MKLATKTLLAFTTAALLGSSAHAATITVQDSYFNTGDQTGITVTAMTATAGEVWTIPSAVLGLTAGTSDKLVVSIGQRREPGETVTYGGVEMLTAVKQSGLGSNDGHASIYYLDTFTLGGNLVITSNGNSSGNKGDLAGMTIMAFVLSGTEAGVADTDADDGAAATSVSLTTGADGGFVVAATGTFGNPSSETFTGGTIATVDAGQSQQAAWNGTTATTYSYSTSGQDGAAVMAYFAPVPEPGSLALLGLGGLLIARRRRG